MNTNILKSPVLSEKSNLQLEKGIYTFMVDKKSDKKQIAKFVENQFGVKVTKVNVSKKQAKTKRIAQSRKEVQVGGGKKATIWLAKGQSIAVLSPKSDKKEKKEKTKEAKSADKSNDKKESKGLISRFKKSETKNKKDSK